MHHAAPDTPPLMPREKMLAHGAAALSDAELLALMLRTGIKGKPVLELSQELLDNFGGLHGLLDASLDDLKSIKGLGPSKQTQLAATLEMARRSLHNALENAPVFNTPEVVQDYLLLHLGQRSKEVFAALFLDSKHRLIAFEELFAGTVNRSAVYPREVAVRCLHHHATAVILAHNHPSGDVQPSPSDIAITKKLKTGLAVLEITVLDHVVVGNTRCYSMHTHQLL